MSLARFGVSIPARLVQAFDKRIRAKGYRNRSQAIRDIIRNYLVEGEWERGDRTVVGAITVVYDHHTRELTRALTEMQHQFQGEIRCSTHVHLDGDNCLEVIVVRGRSQEVQRIADRLISIRGVKHGKLVCTTTGEALT